MAQTIDPAWLAHPDTSNYTQEVITNGIEANQGKGNVAVGEVSKLANQINDLLNALSAAPQINATLGTPTTQVTDIVLPDAPTKPTLNQFPVMGSLLDVLPQFPELSPYYSQLASQLQVTLFNLVIGLVPTGLNPTIEQQIWDRARERTTATTQGVIDGIARQYARAGWDLPIGDEVERYYQALEDQAAQDITESRSIAIAQADLEQKNFQFSIQQSVALETLMSGLWSDIQKLLVDSEKTRVSALNESNQVTSDVYKNSVQAASAQADATASMYKAEADAYQAIASAEGERVKAQVAKLEQETVYLSKQAEVQIESIKANVATFLSQKELMLGAAKAMAQIWSQLAASFGSSVNYSASVSASDSVSMNNSNSSSFSVSVSDSTVHSD